MNPFLTIVRRRLNILTRRRIESDVIDAEPPHASRVPPGVKFRRPWHASEYAAHRELWGECGPGHLLYHVQARQVASRHDCDDVLFELFGDNAPAPFAVVHLTWGRHPDPHPGYPSTWLYASFEEWMNQDMNPEADEWAELNGDDEDEEENDT